MKPEDLIVVLAELDGWVRTDPRPGHNIRPFWTRVLPQPDQLIPDPRMNEFAWFESLPKYLEDLNTMNHLERKLDFVTPTFRTGSFNLYRDTLQRMTGADNWGRASAAQRAEALARTFNLWKES